MSTPLLTLDISDVARRTGLTTRALRFYEARGLVRPLRSAAGWRFYGAVELGFIQQAMVARRPRAVCAVSTSRPR